MKNNILQKVGVYEKGPVGQVIGLFQKYSTILDTIFDQPIANNQNIFFMDENGDVIHCGHALTGIQKIVALIAIGKQKKTPNATLSHEKKLNIHQVVRKDRDSVVGFNEKFIERQLPQVPTSYSGWNHILPLSQALKEVMILNTHDREMRVMLAGLIMTYLHLQSIPTWLVLDEITSDWDDLVLEMVNDFIPEKFVRRAYAKGYGTLVQELADNLVFSTTRDLIDRVKKSSANQVNPSS